MFSDGASNGNFNAIVHHVKDAVRVDETDQVKALRIVILHSHPTPLMVVKTAVSKLL